MIRRTVSASPSKGQAGRFVFIWIYLYIGGMRDRRIFKDLLGLMALASLGEQELYRRPDIITGPPPGMIWPDKPKTFTSSNSNTPSNEKRKQLRKKRKKRNRR